MYELDFLLAYKFIRTQNITFYNELHHLVIPLLVSKNPWLKPQIFLERRSLMSCHYMEAKPREIQPNILWSAGMLREWLYHGKPNIT